ncbi:MAG: chemotaxis response regulator protein-glutamate methylesterase [Treponema sp.]|nr:chemotaxis response regulator protein-glutamate methylesterase [Candidatus Treponema caballi]
MIKVFIIDDSAVVRETLTQILSDEKDFEVVGTAADPVIALKKLETITPDVITLDIEMPRMDGISFLKQIMETKPIPVVICSSMAEEGSHNAMKAIEYGASEIILKPKIGTKVFLEESRILICDAVRAAYLARGRCRGKKPESSFAVNPKLTADVILPAGPARTEKEGPTALDTTEKIVVIGASTGGTEALAELLSALPSDAPGMVIVQHMPEHFTEGFANRLDGISKVHVKEAKDGDSVIPGTALIAPGGKHTLIKRSGARYYVEVREGPLVSRHRPSVDVLFRSASRYAGKNAVGVILTGMGDDGARGMLEMKQTGAFTIAQDEKSCVIFGMPNEAIKAGAVDTILPLREIPAEIVRRTTIY